MTLVRNSRECSRGVFAGHDGRVGSQGCQVWIESTVPPRPSETAGWLTTIKEKRRAMHCTPHLFLEHRFLESNLESNRESNAL